MMHRTLYASDCLDILNDEEKLPSGSVDLIYLDPPFNSNSTYNLPFKSRDRSLKPVEAFNDTWNWNTEDDSRLRDLSRNPQTRSLAAIVNFALEVESAPRRRKISLAAYLLNMSLRLRAMKRLLKDTGSIYLHCDPTASHYLKMIMDAIYGRRQFRNEIIWQRRQDTHNRAKNHMGRNHDVILWFSASIKHQYRIQYLPYSPDYIDSSYNKEDSRGRYRLLPCTNETGGNRPYEFRGVVRAWRFSAERMQNMYDDGLLYQAREGSPFQYKKYLADAKGVPIQDIWTDIPGARGRERLGYPTQKSLALMERIISASSNEGDLVLDPFCGCGTTAHAAEALGRKWIGIDISQFSTGLIRRRMLDNFRYLNSDDIFLFGTPETVAEARALAQRDAFEFEKWVCGAMGANGMYKRPGEKGADGGVDGVMELPVIRQAGSKYESQDEYVIIQVKGGNVTPDSVKALSETVRRLGAIAGILVCFQDQLSTVENQRSKEQWADAYNRYPVIQGFSIEDLLAGRKPDMPPTYGYRHRGKTSALQLN